MTMRNLFAILMTVLSLAANANPCDDGGIGGTGRPIEHGIGGTGITQKGIGGTGINPEISEGIGGTGINTAQGIGGTGITNKGIGGTGLEADGGIGGTGIVGVITGFGSICVNGLEVHYFTDTPIDLDGKNLSSDALNIGQVVAVRATENASGFYAHEIHAYNQISGPITSVDKKNNQLKVMGQVVSTNASQLNSMQVGQWINVSGLRKTDGSLTATRVDITKPQKNVQLVGQIERKGNQYYINGTKIDGVAKVNLDNAKDTRVTGTWDGNMLNIKDISIGPVSNLLQRVDKFYLQGYLNNDLANGRVMLNGQQMGITGSTQIKGNNANIYQSGKPVVVHGLIKEGKSTVLSISPNEISNDRKNGHDSKSSTDSIKHSGNVDAKTSTKEVETNHTDLKNDVENYKVETVEKVEQIEKVEAVEKVERVEKVETPEKVERVEKVETPEKIERVEKVETPEKIERVEKVERAETY